MSTSIYIHCVDHEPHLSSGEVGTRLSELDRIRDDIKNKEYLIQRYEDDFGYGLSDERLRTTRFLVSHQNCTLAIFDEYGVEHPIEKPEEVSDDSELPFTRAWVEEMLGQSLADFQWEYCKNVMQKKRLVRDVSKRYATYKWI